MKKALGLTLVEVLVAIAVLSLVLVAMNAVLLSSIRQTAISGSRTQAVQILNYLGRRVVGGETALLPPSGTAKVYDYGSLGAAFPGTGTNTYTLGGFAGAGTVNVTNMGTGVGTTQFTGTPSFSAFTGTLNIGFNGLAGGFSGKLAASNIGTSAATINVLPGATLLTSGNAATTFLYGGALGEALGQLRLTGTNTGNIVLAGVQANNGSLGGNATESGVVSGNISELGPVPRTLRLAYGTGGTITLSGTNTFTGGVNIGGTGTLIVSSAANLGAAPAVKDAGTIALAGGSLSLTNATALTLDPNYAFAVTAAGTLTGAAGNITIGGTSTLTNTLNLNLNAGNLTFAGNVNPFGQFSAAPGGTLTRNAVVNSVANTITFGGQTNLTAINNLGVNALTVDFGAGAAMLANGGAQTLWAYNDINVGGSGTLSLGGGGTDLPSYYREHGGFLVAAAIDKYVYLTQHRTFQEEIIVKYSKLERVASVDQIEHPIIREALKGRFPKRAKPADPAQ